jgi:hypothetical protein
VRLFTLDSFGKIVKVAQKNLATFLIEKVSYLWILEFWATFFHKLIWSHCN